MNRPLAVAIAGHSKQLYADVRVWECGSITDGVSFNFAGEGGWVIDIEELARIVRLARKHRRQRRSPK